MGYLHIFILHCTHTHTHAYFNHIVWFYKMHYKCLVIWTLFFVQGKQSFYDYLQQKYAKYSFCYIIKIIGICKSNVLNTLLSLSIKEFFFPFANLEGFSDLQNCIECSLSPRPPFPLFLFESVHRSLIYIQI